MANKIRDAEFQALWDKAVAAGMEAAMLANIRTGHEETQTNEEYFKLPHEADANSAANMVITNILKANLYQQ